MHPREIFPESLTRSHGKLQASKWTLYVKPNFMHRAGVNLLRRDYQKLAAKSGHEVPLFIGERYEVRVHVI